MSKMLKSQYNLFWNIKNLLYIAILLALPIISTTLSINHYPTSYKQQEIKNEMSVLLAKKEALQQQKTVSNFDCTRIRKINQDIKTLRFTQDYAKPIALTGILAGSFCLLSLAIAFIVFKQLGNQAKKSDTQMYKNFMKAWRLMQFIVLFFFIALILSCSIFLIIIDLWGPIILLVSFGAVICLQTIGIIYTAAEEDTDLPSI